jgi:hypothetical protein
LFHGVVRGEEAVLARRKEGTRDDVMFLSPYMKNRTHLLQK